MVRIIAIVVFGDLSVFLAFVLFGMAEHGAGMNQAILRTALPFGISWVAIAPWLGAYKESTLFGSKQLARTLFKLSLIWLICGAVALVARDLLTDRSFIVAFAVVSILTQWFLLIIWRSIIMLAAGRLFKR